jgi:DNA-binding response OmpR family regulator
VSDRVTEPTARRRVLVVSDELNAGRFLARVLEDAGFEIVTCPVDDIAIELASSFPAFDAVLGDRIDSTVVRRVRNLADPDRAATPVVILARQDVDADALGDVGDAGPSIHLSMPISEHELVRAVSEVMPEPDNEQSESDSPAHDDD